MYIKIGKQPLHIHTQSLSPSLFLSPGGGCLFTRSMFCVAHFRLYWPGGIGLSGFCKAKNIFPSFYFILLNKRGKKRKYYIKFS